MPDSNNKDKTTQKEAGQSAAASKSSTIKTARKTTSGTVQKAEKAQVKEVVTHELASAQHRYTFQSTPPARW